MPRAVPRAAAAGDVTRPCPRCAGGRTFTSNSGLYAHMRRVHTDYVFTDAELASVGAEYCPHCGVLKSRASKSHQCRNPVRTPPPAPAAGPRAVSRLWLERTVAKEN